MLSPVAQQFALARTAANLNALWQAEPQTAADWLVRYGKTAGISSPQLIELKQTLETQYETPDARAAALRQFAANNAQVLSAVELGALQAARAATLGFVAGAPAPATLTGTVSVVDGQPVLTTPDGSFRVDSPNWMQSLQYKYFEANALQAFNGRTVTVRAWPTDTPGLLAVEEFSPGTSPDFVSGRLSRNAENRVGIRVRTDKWVEIRDPELARRVSSMAHGEQEQVGGTGVIMSGPVVKENGQFFYDGGADRDFWMLSKTLNGQPTRLQVGHGLERPFSGDVSVADNSGRILVLGRIGDDGETIEARGALATPATRFENGVPFRRDDTTLGVATPVDLTPIANDERGFGL